MFSMAEMFIKAKGKERSKRCHMKKSLLTAFLLLGAVPVLAQSKTPAVWLVFGDYVRWLFVTIGGEYGTADFIMVLRILMSVLLFALFFVLLGKTLFKDPETKKFKGAHIGVSLALALMFALFTPATLLGTMAITYSALFFAAILVIVFAGAMYLVFETFKEETFGNYWIKAFLSMIAAVVLTWLSNVPTEFSDLIASNPTLVVKGDVPWLWSAIQLIGGFGSVFFAVAIIYFIYRAFSGKGHSIMPNLSTPKTATPYVQQGAFNRMFSGWSKTPENQINVVLGDIASLDSDIHTFISAMRQGVNAGAFRGALAKLDGKMDALDEALRTPATMTGKQAEYKKVSTLIKNVRGAISAVLTVMIKEQTAGKTVFDSTLLATPVGGTTVKDLLINEIDNANDVVIVESRKLLESMR